MPKYWTAVVSQGGGVGTNQMWATQIRVDSSINGIEWQKVDGGKIFEASRDKNTKNRI